MSSPGSTYRRADGLWVAALTVNGKRKVSYGKTEKEAKQELAKLQAEVATLGKLTDSGRRTVANLIDFWLETVKPTLKPRTHNDYGLIAKRYILPYVGNIKLNRLEPAHLQSLYAKLQGKGLTRAPSHAHAVLHRALKLAVLWSWLPLNVADRTIRNAYKPPRKEIWTADQLAGFIRGTEGHGLQPL